MIDTILYFAFLPAVIALVLTPGPDMMFAMAQGLRGGAGPALAAAAGISMGVFINSALAGLGLDAIVSRAPWVFSVIRWVGVAYLLWLAYKSITTRLSPDSVQSVRPSRAFRDGLIINLSNPSVIFFILAFIPQFVDPTRPILAQFLVYGGTICVVGFAVKAAVGLTAGGIGRVLVKNVLFERLLRWISATIFGALALRLAVAGTRS
ncbi:MAG: LysE family translocator [Boseongicola sp.]|nr:LysE family translocator [Boseongicola sp.]